MAKRKKSHRKTKFPVSIFFYFLTAAAGVTAWNSCSETSVANEPDSPQPETPGSGVAEKHYPGLETVSIPENLASQIKEYVGFTVSFNKDNGTPNYVAWELLGEEVKTDVDRSDNFWTDPDIEGCPSTKDYTRSGYDRGHMCPAADQKWSQEAMDDCFVMANICPQDHGLNAGAWNTLESKERQWAKRDSAIMIIAGPIYETTDTKRIGNAGVRVPGAFFKVLMAPYVDEPRGIAFVYPNMTSPGNMQDYSMSIDELEKILGYDFFPALPDEIENKVEATYSFKEWNISK
ncbi:MAG: DNA/RNA non-specific endonuclease [Muribaculaceae bacterium]|nr:DNA/RNA non-specific endonuclease [Muribaculaceae bacterium]